jgi:hypothetical protein
MIGGMASDTAYDRWRGLAFPPGSASDHVDELHTDLAYWDSMVADTVIPVAERGEPYDSGVLDLEAGLRALAARISAVSVAASGEDAGLLCQYAAYADALLAATTEAALTG